MSCIDVHVPLIPTPPVIPPVTGSTLALGWTVRLVFPGRSAPSHAITRGTTVTFEALRGESMYLKSPCDSVFVTVRRGDEVVGHGEIDVRDVRRVVAGNEPVTLPAPFALPEGTFVATLSIRYGHGPDRALEVRGRAPVVLDADL
jgi:hypothetical protein